MQNYCNLNEEEKNIISDAIIAAIMDDVKEVYAENNLHHKNGYSMLVWDFIGSKVIDKLKDTRLKAIKVRRGRFSFDIILDEEHHTVYTIMKKSNIEKVKKEKNSSHYLWALASINCDLKIEQGQLNLFTTDYNSEYKEMTKRNLLSGVESIVDRYCTIVINDDNKHFPSIQMAVFDMNINTVYEESWKDSVINYELENDNYISNFNINNPVIKIKEERFENILKIKNQEKVNEKEG